MNRKDFLKTLTFGAIPLLAKPSALLEKPVMDTSGWKQILQLALTCPSVYNAQPWKVRLNSENEASVYFDASKRLAYSDTTTAFEVLSMSMFVETILLAASHFGYSTSVKHKAYARLPSGYGLVHFADVSIKKDSIKPIVDVATLYKRRTARFGYTAYSVEEHKLSAVNDVAAQYDQQFNCTFMPGKIDDILRLEVRTRFKDLDDLNYRSELQRWIRTHDSELATRDGLSTKCLGYPNNITADFFDEHYKYESGVRKFLLKMHYRSTLKNTNNVMLCNDFKTYADWIACGKGLINTWLKMAELDLYLHPFGDLVSNPEAHKQLCGDILRSEKNVWFIARFGYCKTPPASIRKNIEDVLLG